MEITQDILSAIMPNANESDIEHYLEPLQTQLAAFEINTPLRVAHFLAQIAHESGQFKYKSENLNYSAKALRAVFGKYFKTDEEAEKSARQPENIANIVYANRMGNGGTETGDGWNYRGRGLIQLTGKDNYRRCGEAIDCPLVDEPDSISDNPHIAVATACYFWQSARLNELADKDDLKGITKRINGGYHGLDQRAGFLNRAKQYLSI